MLALLAANAYLGIEDANLQHFYWFLCALAMLAVCLIGFRLRSLLCGATREKGILDYISTARKNPRFK